MTDDLVLEIVKLIFAILGPVLTGLAVALVYKLLQKVGIELDETKKDQISKVLFKLVAQTEEWASVKVKNGMPVTAQQKAEYYLALVADKLPGVDSTEATAVAKQILGHAKLAASGVVRDVRVAVESK